MLFNELSGMLSYYINARINKPTGKLTGTDEGVCDRFEGISFYCK
jgi:hypothetical protein